MPASLPPKLEEAWKGLSESIVEDMTNDGPDWIKSWSFEQPMNAVTGKPYRGRNMLLLMAAMRAFGFTDPRFATFSTAKDAGWSVKKGSRSVPIEKWKRFVFLKEDPDKRIKQPKTEQEWRDALDDPDLDVRFRCVGYFNVFNAEQIEGIPPRSKAQGVAIDDELIDELERKSPCPVHEALQDLAGYAPSLDEIFIPSRTQFASSDAMARVLLHEQAHSTGHPSRCDRPMSTDFGSDEYAREELVAELGALFTATSLGIRFDSIDVGEIGHGQYWQTHVAYLKGWSSRFDDPAAEVRAAAGKATSASEFLLRPYKEELALAEAEKEEASVKASVEDCPTTSVVEMEDHEIETFRDKDNVVVTRRERHPEPGDPRSRALAARTAARRSAETGADAGRKRKQAAAVAPSR